MGEDPGEGTNEGYFDTGRGGLLAVILLVRQCLSKTPEVAHTEHLPRIPIEGDSSHLDRACHALSRCKLRYRIIGGIGSGGRAWGHATFLVCSLLGGQMQLYRAGFLQSSESNGLLIDSEKGWKTRLLDERPKTDP